MNFKTQISTTREQSERLLALGVKPETADMSYHYMKSKITRMEWELQVHPPTMRGKFWIPERIAKLSSPFHKRPDGSPMTGEEVFDSIWGKDVPSWSLSRLLEMMPKYIDEREEVLLMIEPPLVIYYDTRYKGQQYFTTNPNIFDNCVATIDWLIRKGHFNTEYLIGDKL